MIRCPILSVLLVATCAWPHAGPEGDADPAEILLKARAIKAAAFFTTFPASPPTDRPWMIGILGSPLFGKALESLLPPGALMKGRPVRIAYPRSRSEVESLDVIFISASEKGRLPEVLGWVQGRPILTLGDTPGFMEKGTMIHLAVEEDRVRPWVNLKAAQGSGLSFSSFFLANAKVLGK